MIQTVRRQPLKIHLFLSAVVALLPPAAGSSPLAGEDQTARTYYRQAENLIGEGDTTAALQLLDRALKADSRHGPSLIARGRLFLEESNLSKARRDFNWASHSSDRAIRSAGFLGLGDVFRKMPRRNLQAAKEYRKAFLADSTNLEALYALAQTGFELEETTGYIMAGKALADLISIDPSYRDAYRLWRDSILDHSPGQLEEVNQSLEQYLSEHPDTAGWSLELAGNRFRIGRPGSALETLARHEKTSPGQKPWKRRLLQARCRLALGDTLGFERDYAAALTEAGRADEFTELYLEAEAIFRPRESEKWSRLKSPAERTAFFRSFWKRRDPDPISPYNERLVTHYMRLHEAQQRYSLANPHSRFQSSRNYFRMLSPRSDTYNVFDYDPDLFFKRSRHLVLDQRGLVFLRHGPPDQVRIPAIDEVSNPTEIWFYGRVFFTFEKRFGAGDFVYLPVYLQGAGNIVEAMETESFRDPLPAFTQDYYGVYFQGPAGRLEVEVYQSAPVSAAPLETGPEATLALYDSTWAETALERTTSKKITVAEDSLWIAVNRVLADPGPCFYAVRMDIPGYRAVARKSMELIAPPGRRLDLSGIILGSPPLEGRQVHRRRGINLLPRPSLTFAPGEKITVYFEVYGLRKDRTNRRSFRERVTVGLVEEKAGITSILKKLFRGKKPRRSLTLSFDREPPEAAGPVAEHFEIDTSNLVPGKYSLVAEVRDNSTGRRRGTGVSFELEPPETR